MGMQTLLLFCHYEIRERYFGFLLRSLNALLIQNRHSLVGWEASFLKLPEHLNPGKKSISCPAT